MRFAIYSQNNQIHIVNRGVSKRKIFKHDHDYRYFMYLVSKYKHLYRINLIQECIMPNHFHLLINCPKNSKQISNFMQRLQQSYAKYFNREYCHSGHVFQGQYQFSVIFTEKSLANVKDYIRQNPVKANLVQKPEDWPYHI